MEKKIINNNTKKKKKNGEIQRSSKILVHYSALESDQLLLRT